MNTVLTFGSFRQGKEQETNAPEHNGLMPHYFDLAILDLFALVRHLKQSIYFRISVSCQPIKKDMKMQDNKILSYIKNVLENMPTDWLRLTTHRLDIYNEKLAKVEFIEQFENLFNENNAATSALSEIPTAYDYIRLGHPLSCVLEWAIAKLNHVASEGVISFSSRTTPVLAVLRKNLLDNKNTRILHLGELPSFLDAKALEDIYNYKCEINKIENIEDISAFNGNTILITEKDLIHNYELNSNIDFALNIHADLGSILLINGEGNKKYIPEIQHVRRRETIAMTPINCQAALHGLINNSFDKKENNRAADKKRTLDLIQEITATEIKPLVGSSGLSVQYAIMMGLVDDALENHSEKEIKFIVPTNCYGGTNDQARRVAACINNVEVVDLSVDGENDMVQSIDAVLHQMAEQNAVPYIIAEIPTNPRVEVPDLIELKNVLSAVRKTKNNETAIAPVFILDQTFCPNIHFLGEGEILSSIKTISYASGSKFPSGGLCTAGYCVANKKAGELMKKVEKHLLLCDNEATNLQYEILAKQMPSMKQRIQDAYKNTREFVNFISENLPDARINFVSEELAEQGFTPSVFSLDLPTKGNTAEEKENYKRELNHKLIQLMISNIPNESKYCVSYGQLKGCYWTIPATSTQGTTKEGDKDYIARVSLSPNMDLDKHKEVFLEFVKGI